MSKRLLAGVLAVIMVVAVAVGCAQVSRKPAPSPTRQLKQEPTISLFIKETGEKKTIKLEEYIMGVISGEIEPTWPKEALAAQAIIARTFTLKKMQQGKTKAGTDASTDVKEFQAYRPERINDNVRRAVENTRGEVITWRGQLVNAFFHSCSGGMTATAPEGLGFTQEPTPYLRAVKDETCDTPEKQNWTANFSKQKIKDAAAQVGAQIGDFNSVEIAEKGPSGRATKLKFGTATLSAPGLRLAIGPDQMKSTLFSEVMVNGDQVVFKGHGWGHGVGMAQESAKKKAERGQKAEQIVRHYYRGVKIEKWYK